MPCGGPALHASPAQPSRPAAAEAFSRLWLWLCMSCATMAVLLELLLPLLHHPAPACGVVVVVLG